MGLAGTGATGGGKRMGRHRRWLQRLLQRLHSVHNPLEEDHGRAALDVERDVAGLDAVVAEERGGGPLLGSGPRGGRRGRRRAAGGRARGRGRSGPTAWRRGGAPVEWWRVGASRRGRRRLGRPSRLQRHELHAEVEHVGLAHRRRRPRHQRDLSVEDLLRRVAVVGHVERPAVPDRDVARGRGGVAGPVVRRPRLLHGRAARVPEKFVDRRVKREVSAQVPKTLREVPFRVQSLPLLSPSLSSQAEEARGDGRGPVGAPSAERRRRHLPPPPTLHTRVTNKPNFKSPRTIQGTKAGITAIIFIGGLWGRRKQRDAKYKKV